MRAHVYAALQTQLFHCPDTWANKFAGVGEQRESREYKRKKGKKKKKKEKIEFLKKKKKKKIEFLQFYWDVAWSNALRNDSN